MDNRNPKMSHSPLRNISMHHNGIAQTGIPAPTSHGLTARLTAGQSSPFTEASNNQYDIGVVHGMDRLVHQDDRSGANEYEKKVNNQE
jgi:hypothetical protein